MNVQYIFDLNLFSKILKKTFQNVIGFEAIIKDVRIKDSFRHRGYIEKDIMGITTKYSHSSPLRKLIFFRFLFCATLPDSTLTH